MKRMLLLAALLAAAPTLFAQDTTYRWVDDRGQINYSDLPPPAHVQEVERQRFKPGAADAALPYAVRKAAENFPVTLYVTEECGDPCDSARKLLDGRGVPYAENALDSETAHEAYRKAIGVPVEVPALLVGRFTRKGFLENDWQRLLDDAGYPRTALPGR
ncbi:DUF4124 domain-containing protein [Pseudothauera rhizosphaerae]|uniref:DUF4124 domain-containing protein n=1 Tax=Pseudothauera rhizosphaerae TaxID=2565932 RepID=A0A4S4AWI1_9RHOO|nr:DUF4124 domain-containing protein [Pseudothauera rhizosphaerae]THF64404.1 DUF4124 domain-containing protein [Pseudothauera rhizosphaerae]